MPDITPLVFTEELILLCEGPADHNFFESLFKNRSGLSKFDMLNPEKYNSRDGFGLSLKAIRGSGHVHKGVLIVADSHDDPQATFKHVCKQIRSAGGYPIPSKLLEVAKAPNVPAVAVMLLPDETRPGGLESLCVQVLEEKYPWAQSCVNQFLKCDKIEAYKFPPEKLDKARYQCMVAALNQSDPSKAVRYAFNGSPPLLDISSQCFDDVERKLKEFCSAVAES